MSCKRLDDTHGHGMESKRSYVFIKEFEDACTLVIDNTVSKEIIFLKLFSFCLKDATKMWFLSLRPLSIHLWQTLQREFLRKFFSEKKTKTFRH